MWEIKTNLTAFIHSTSHQVLTSCSLQEVPSAHTINGLHHFGLHVHTMSVQELVIIAQRKRSSLVFHLPLCFSVIYNKLCTWPS